eukprot:comp9633_c0_seq1/m.4645 comp9633_c0_seq1/g.4645  ORF comp9633_c0_seq1/g.4645 comp9633_c0_seq1/m.4645 type:complete len:264 (-) comp9633_c0_seq1:501-1292(-)
MPLMRRLPRPGTRPCLWLFQLLFVVVTVLCLTSGRVMLGSKHNSVKRSVKLKMSERLNRPSPDVDIVAGNQTRISRLKALIRKKHQNTTLTHWQEGHPQLNGIVVKAAFLGQSRMECDNTDVCDLSYLCVRHTRRKEFFVLNRMGRERTLAMDLGYKGLKEIPLVVRPLGPKVDVVLVRGTTHLFTELYNNRFFYTVNAFALRRTISRFSPAQSVNLMLMEDFPFAYDPPTEPIIDVYRATQQHKPPLYILDTALGGTPCNLF